MKLNTKFDINEKVQLIDLNISGRIIGIFIGTINIEYNIRYFL